MMIWLSQMFMHPAMAAGGAALISVPIIIHLINRMKYRKVRFAAMEFLLQSQQQNRRRILVEQLLLLLLRILIILGLVALFARLVLDPSQLSLLERPQTHHLVVLDDSGSMRDRWGETTGWKQGLKTVKRIASEMANQEGVHTLTLIQTSEPDRTASNFTRREIDVSLLSELEDKLETMQRDCGYGRPQWADTFPAIDRVLATGDEENSVIHVLSDFRQTEWGQSPSLVADIKSLAAENRSVNLIPVVPSQHENLAVTSFGGELHTAAVMVPIELTAEIKNYGESLAENIAIRVLVDGEPIPQSISIPKLNPGESAQESFEITLTSAGEHAISIQIPADSLEADNSRYLTLDVPERQRVLLADGSDETEEAQYIADALSADPSITGIEVVIVRAEDVRDQDLSQFSAVYLMNVPQLSDDTISMLTAYVKQGGGVAWFMGDKVDANFYRKLAVKDANAKKLASQAEKKSGDQATKETEGNVKKTDGFESLFPVMLAVSPSELERADESNPGADLNLGTHPLFEILNAESGMLANFINVYHYFSLENAEGATLLGNAHVIGKLRNQEPVFIESRLGEGRIFISLSSAGPMSASANDRWHNWPFDINAPGFTVFHLELTKYLGSKQGVRSASEIGESIVIEVNPSVYTQNVRFTPPEGVGRSSVTISATMKSKTPAKSGEATGDEEEKQKSATEDNNPEEESDSLLFAEYNETGTPGVYAVGREELSRDVKTDFYAFNVPGDEGQLQLTSSEELRSKLASIDRVVVQNYGELNGIEPSDPGRELRMLLLLLLVLFLIAEQALAYRLSFHSSQSGSSRGAKRSGALEEGLNVGGGSKISSPSPVHSGGNI